MAMAASTYDSNGIEVNDKRLYMKNVWYWSSKMESWLCFDFFLVERDTLAKKNGKINAWCRTYSYSYLWTWLLEDIREALTARGHGDACFEIQVCRKDQRRSWGHPTWHEPEIEAQVVKGLPKHLPYPVSQWSMKSKAESANTCLDDLNGRFLSSICTQCLGRYLKVLIWNNLWLHVFETYLFYLWWHGWFTQDEAFGSQIGLEKAMGVVDSWTMEQLEWQLGGGTCHSWGGAFW